MTKPDQTLLRGIHVLVVEDHDDSRFIVEASLRYCGALVTAVRSASEALGVVRKVTPDIVLADVAMPFHDASGCSSSFAPGNRRPDATSPWWR